jgi:transglutaminase-like putative cysteine protease
VASRNRNVSTDGWRLQIEHTTTFTYAAPVRASYNEVRMSPLTTTRQTALECRVRTTPVSPQYSYRDYWGTQVVAFNVGRAHPELMVQGASLVDTQPPARAMRGTWREVEGGLDRMAEYLVASPYTQSDDRLEAIAKDLARATPLETVEAVVEWVHNALVYVPGFTSVRTSALEAWEAGRGVCQDFAHLALTVLRGAGVPARYVSGYLHPEVDAAIGEVGVGESHAWIEAWAGGWWGLDPTNGGTIGPRHVLVARGRDYADVTPFKGVYAGNAPHETSVRVHIVRVS